MYTALFLCPQNSQYQYINSDSTTLVVYTCSRYMYMCMHVNTWHIHVHMHYKGSLRVTVQCLPFTCIVWTEKSLHGANQSELLVSLSWRYPCPQRSREGESLRGRASCSECSLFWITAKMEDSCLVWPSPPPGFSDSQTDASAELATFVSSLQRPIPSFSGVLKRDAENTPFEFDPTVNHTLAMKQNLHLGSCDQQQHYHHRHHHHRAPL